MSGRALSISDASSNGHGLLVNPGIGHSNTLPMYLAVSGVNRDMMLYKFCSCLLGRILGQRAHCVLAYAPSEDGFSSEDVKDLLPSREEQSKNQWKLEEALDVESHFVFAF